MARKKLHLQTPKWKMFGNQPMRNNMNTGKKNLTISMDGPGNVNKGNGLQPDIIHYQSAVENEKGKTNDIPMTSSIQQINDVLEPEQDVDINKTFEDWNLNDDQACAFRIISQHSLQNRPK